jgi:hemerythrin-like domain-containing protein
MKITELLAVEHTIYLGVFDLIEKSLPSLSSPAEVRTMAGIVEGLLGGHAKRESQLAYLALDHVLAQKDELDRMHQDHQEIDNRLKKVHTAETCAEARRLLKAAITSSREHFRLEEKQVFPLLEKTLQRETLIELGKVWSNRNSEFAGAM